MEKYILAISNATVPLYKQIGDLELARLRQADIQEIRRQKSKTLAAVNVVRSQLNELVEALDLKGYEDKEAL